MNLVLIGPQGSGKDTQGHLLEEKLKIPLLSIGQYMREAVASNSLLGNQVDQYIKDGNLVPDEICDSVLRERLNKPDCANGYILDGSPRTGPQAILLDYNLWGKNQHIDKVILLTITDEEIIKRLKGRAEEALKKGETPRSDDLNEHAIKRRIINYKNNIEVIRMYYEMKGILLEVDAMPDIQTIHLDIMKSLNA